MTFLCFSVIPGAVQVSDFAHTIEFLVKFIYLFFYHIYITLIFIAIFNLVSFIQKKHISFHYVEYFQSYCLKNSENWMNQIMTRVYCYIPTY